MARFVDLDNRAVTRCFLTVRDRNLLALKSMIRIPQELNRSLVQINSMGLFRC